MNITKIIIAITIITAIIGAGGAGAQGLTVLAPREIDKARTKVEDTWTAWQAVPRPEAGLLDKSRKQALADIDRSADQASRYLDAKAEFYTRLSEAFHQQTEALRQDDAHMAASGLTSTERQRLDALLDREKTTRRRIDELEKQANRSSRQQLELESLQRQQKDLARLQDEIRKRIDILDQSSHDEEKARASRAALIERLNEIVAILDSRVEAIDVEKTHWRDYHQQLRDLVNEKGRKP
jgi:DNA repair exonuclease SbcCD ATPase subunit